MNNQLNIFDFLYPNYKITKPIRLIELFAGYGSQALALKYLGVNFEHWKISEWAIKSIQAYKDMHFENDNIDYCKDFAIEIIIDTLYQLGISNNYNESMTYEQIKRLNEKQLRTIYNNIIATNNLVNIKKMSGSDLEIIDTDKYDYILTYSFPCQDLSLAGKGKGMSDTTTRSGMLWEVERILSECYELGTLPQILLMENVPQVHSQDNIKDFNKWQLRLEELGYKNYCQDLIATDYGIPQTRNRCFMVSILGDYNYTFPQPIPLKLKLKDLLEDDVDEKYYLSDKMINFYYENENKQKEKGNGFKFGVSDGNVIAKTITTRAGSRMDDNFIKIKNATKKGYLTATAGDGIDISSRMEHHRGTVQKNKSQTLTTSCDVGVVVNDKNLKKELCNELIVKKFVKENDVIKHSYTNSRYNDWNKRNVEKNNICPTLDTRSDCLGVVVKDTENYIEWNQDGRLDIDCRAYKEDKVSPTIPTSPKSKVFLNDLRIRKLTPKECFRLMGVKDEDFKKVRKNQTDNSLYHLAGDSIVVNILCEIFKQLLI